jgi:hypothetical protein
VHTFKVSVKDTDGREGHSVISLEAKWHSLFSSVRIVSLTFLVPQPFAVTAQKSLQFSSRLCHTWTSMMLSLLS